MSISLGIDIDRNLVYEGSLGDGRPIWPSPVIAPAAMRRSDGEIDAEQQSAQHRKYFGLVFREDFFDPIARIRRGRFYQAGDQQPVNWHAYPHPAVIEGPSPSHDGRYPKSLHTFYRASISAQLRQIDDGQAVFEIGFESASTFWTIVSIESAITGEELVTLRSSRSFGLLPTVDWSQVPSDYQSTVRETLQKLIEETHRATSESIIDRARDAASQILLAYYEQASTNARDLGKLANRLADEKQLVSASASRIIARLHARAKPSERARRSLPPIREQDAELATLCVGTLLRELGWAKWS